MRAESFEARGTHTREAFGKENGRDNPIRAGLPAPIAPYAEGKKFLLGQSVRWPDDLGRLQKMNQAREGNHTGAFSDPSKKCSTRVK